MKEISMEIRKAQPEEVDRVMEIYAAARRFMAEHGNPTQWGNNYPSQEQVEKDIAEGKCFVCIEGKQIAAVFYFAHETDPTYEKIYEGNWQNAEDYAVIHRIASAGNVKGAGSFCINWACSQAENVKIDTHQDNYVMQNLLKKCGFTHCGTIYLENGEPRLAYQKVCK